MGVVYFTGYASDSTSIKANGSKTYYLTQEGSFPDNVVVTGATLTLSKVYSYSSYYGFSVYSAEGHELGSGLKGDGSSAYENNAASFTWDLDTDSDGYRDLSSITIEGDGSTTANMMSIRSGCNIEIAVTYGEYTTPELNSDYPEDVSVMPGESTTLRIKVSSAGYPTSRTYQWYKDGSKISGATGTTLTVTPTEDFEEYYCVVTNAAGSVESRTATVELFRAPVLNSKYPMDVSILPGASTELDIKFSSYGNPNTYTYEWYKNGELISGATKRTLTVSETGTYYCVVTNSIGSAKSRVATVAVASGGAIWINGVKVPATSYVWHNGAWVVATPHCYSDKSWKTCSSG